MLLARWRLLAAKGISVCPQLALTHLQSGHFCSFVLLFLQPLDDLRKLVTPCYPDILSRSNKTFWQRKVGVWSHEHERIHHHPSFFLSLSGCA